MHGVGNTKRGTPKRRITVTSSFNEISTYQLGIQVEVILPGSNPFHSRISG
jgi:hypothetical protein